MGKHRRHKRFSVEIMNIRGRMMFSSMVDIHDISHKTIELLVDARLNLGSPYVLKFEDQNEEVQVRGKVEFSSIYKTVQNDEGDVVPIYKAELSLEDMPEDDIRKLERFIEHHRSHEEERVSKMVCKVRSGEHAILDIPSGYRTKKISLSGMLIESSHPIRVDNTFPMELGLPGYRLIHLLGRVASCLPVKDSDQFDVGIEFIEMSAQDKENLMSFLEMLDTHEHEIHDIWKSQRDR